MGWGTSKADGDKVANTQRYGVELAPGFAFFPTEKIGIEFSVRGLYYQNATGKSEIHDTEVTTNSFGLDASSFAPRIGLQFSFYATRYFNKERPGYPPGRFFLAGPTPPPKHGKTPW